MKKLVVALMLLASLSAGCGEDKVVRGKHYVTYGLLNADERDPHIKYRVVVGNLFWATILIETVIVPIWLLGWEVYEPVGMKD